jgi:hypothetical protein
MDANIRGLLLAGVGGAALAWAAVTLFGDDAGEPRESFGPPPAARSVQLPVAREPAEPTVAAEPAGVPATSSNDAPLVVTTPTPASGTSRLIVIDTPPTGRGSVTDVPNRRESEPDHARAADELLNGARISCDFGGGSNTGTRVGAMLTVGGGADWVGGLIVYDLLDAGAGEARMTGSQGATGTLTGETKVELRISGLRVIFLGELPNGTLVVTTIFPELDDLGRHVAVMSRHEHGPFTYAAQFLGTCQ